MRIGLEEYVRDHKEKTLYSFCSAKKIYFVSTPTRYLLLEKNNSISLKSRNISVTSSRDGVIIFPLKDK